VVAADVIAYAGQPRHGDAPPASAAARTLADLLGIDLGEVSIDPIERRVTREGVALYARTRLQNRPSVAEAKAPSMPLLQEPTRTIRMTGMRGTIAKRMHASLQSMAQLTLPIVNVASKPVAHPATPTMSWRPQREHWRHIPTSTRKSPTTGSQCYPTSTSVWPWRWTTGSSCPSCDMPTG
jgi:hypothetical protein